MQVQCGCLQWSGQMFGDEKGGDSNRHELLIDGQLGETRESDGNG